MNEATTFYLTENIWLLYVWAKNLSMNQKFRLKNIDEARNYSLEEIKQNELMSWSHKGLISNALIDSIISHDEFVLINNVLKEYGDMKEEAKNLKT